MTTFQHPMRKEDITESNYRDIASSLLSEQATELSAYSLTIAEGKWTDDDTDYYRTCLNTTERLMDIAYDGSRDDLVAFLLTPRNLDSATHETLGDMISAGGLCASLSLYEDLIYAAEGE